MKCKELVIVFCFVAVLAIIIHHFIVCGRLFDLGDILHHEWFAVAFGAFGAGLVVGEYID